MKVKIFITAVLLYCFFSSFITFVGINGKWKGEATSINFGDHKVNFTFKTDNDKLTGTSQGTQKEYYLSEGLFKGDSLSFAVEVDNGSKILHSGKYYSNGDSISLNMSFMGGYWHATLTRDTTKN
jgi:hypothetical protein